MSEHNKSQYLNREKTEKDRRSGIKRAIIGGVLFVFLTIGYAAIFIEEGPVVISGVDNIAGTLMFLMVVILILTPPFLLFINGFRKLLYTGRAVKYADIFAGDEDGYLLYSDAAEAMCTSVARVGKDMQELLRRCYFNRVQITEGDPACILLAGHDRNQWNPACYLNEGQLVGEKSSSTVLIVCTGLFIVSFIIMLPMFVVMTVKNRDADTIAFMLGNLAMYGALAYVAIRAIQNKASIKRAGLYNQCMEESPETKIPLRDLADRAGTSTGKVLKDLRWLFGKQIMRDCRLDMRDEVIQLSDIQNGSAAFAALECPGCGMSNTVRVGRVGKCRYCGRFLAAPLNKSAVGMPEPAYIRYSKPRTFTNDAMQAKLRQRRNIYYIVSFFLLMESVIMLVIQWENGVHLLISISPALLIFLGLGLWLGHKGRRISRSLELSGICDYLFSQSRTATITLDDIVGQSGINYRVAKARIADLFKLELLTNCHQKDGTIVLTDLAHTEQAYIRTKCKNCGADVTMKRGFVSVCHYCGSFIDENGITHSKTDGETTVVLLSAGSNKGAVISYLHDLTSMSIHEIEGLLSALPADVVKTGTFGAARIRRDLQELGAEVE